jgi:hypothetical protein
MREWRKATQKTTAVCHRHGRQKYRQGVELRHLIERMARTVSHATCTVDDEPAGQ